MSRRWKPEPGDITIAVDASFDIRFEPNGELGGYSVSCRQLPEVAAHGATLISARAAARRAIKDALEHRADSGEPIPRLRYVPTPRWRRRELPRPA
jgi:predicted RNase H-like HicB family nuclease